MKKIWTNIKKCRIFLTGCKKDFLLLLIFSLLVTLITTIIPSINGMVLNNILNQQFKLAIILVLVVGILQILSMLSNLSVTKKYLTLRKTMILNIRKKVCRAILNLKLEVYQQQGQGNFLNKTKDDSSRIAAYLNNIKDNILITLSSIGVLCIIFYLNHIIGIYYIICTAIIVFIRYYGIKKSIYYKAKNLECLDGNASLLGEIVKGARDIKILKLKDNFIQKTDDSFETIGNLEYKSTSYLDYSSKIAIFLESVFSGMMIFLSIVLIKYDMLKLETFIIIFMYRGSVFNFTKKFASLVNNFGQFNLSLHRILSILEYNMESFGTTEMEQCKGYIEFKNVSFGYTNELVLADFNLRIKENSFTAIVGPSGAGKSTIVSLLTKMITAEIGNIYIDEYSIDELSESSIRNNISLVTQQPFLFHLTIKENLAIIDSNFKHIKDVCKLVGIDKKIESLPLGYDTILDEDALNLSGGEKQKLAIARALLSKTKIILLDEITNNLDNNAKRSIRKLLEKLKSKYTIILITHDLDMVVHSDRIIVLENGTIVGDGTHETLLEQNKNYQKLYRSKEV